MPVPTDQFLANLAAAVHDTQLSIEQLVLGLQAAAGLEGPAPDPDEPLPGDAVPPYVTMFQARAALMQAGLFEEVDAYCQATGGITLQAWEYANHCYRNGELIQGLAPQFDLTDEQVDDLFRTAKTILA